MPDAPSSPSPKLFALVGFTGSLVLGSILALLLEQLDNTLRTERQVEELLGLPSLGLVPKIADTQARRRLHGHMLDRPQSPYAEAVHALHTQVCLTGVGRPPPTLILVTSALPGEGKTRSPRASPYSLSSSATRRCSSTSTSAARRGPRVQGRAAGGSLRCSPAPSGSRTRSCTTRAAGWTCWRPVTTTATRSPS